MENPRCTVLFQWLLCPRELTVLHATPWNSKGVNTELHSPPLSPVYHHWSPEPWSLSSPGKSSASARLCSQLQKSVLLFRARGGRRHPALNCSSGGESKLCVASPAASLETATVAFQASDPFWSVHSTCIVHRLPGQWELTEESWIPVQSHVLCRVLTEVLRVFSTSTSITWSQRGRQLPGLLHSILTTLPTFLPSLLLSHTTYPSKPLASPNHSQSDLRDQPIL